tara:strand:- start:182 stop:505 length:324 start_codon:yes stop_codon:yes gene_type:complete
MSKKEKTITSNGSLQEIYKYQKSPNSIEGSFEIGGNFDGGTLSLHLSLSDGEFKNAWQDLTGVNFETTTAVSKSFKFPASPESNIIIYYTLAGATSPNIKITFIDNT